MILNLRAIMEQLIDYMFCNKIHEMIPLIDLHLEKQYEIQKFQFLGYEFKQKLAPFLSLYSRAGHEVGDSRIKGPEPGLGPIPLGSGLHYLPDGSR